jgi:hypothetical protein
MTILLIHYYYCMSNYQVVALAARSSLKVKLCTKVRVYRCEIARSDEISDNEHVTDSKTLDRGDEMDMTATARRGEGHTAWATLQ